MVHFLGTNAVTMVDFLTNIWDEDDRYENKTKNKGEDDIQGPYISMLGCMTPEITTAYLKQSIITGGFTRRAIFVLAHRRGDPIAIPEISVAQKAARNRCLDWLMHLKEFCGHIQWTDESRSKWTSWYNGFRNDTNRIIDPATMGYYESKSTQVLKLSILLSLAESTDLILQWKYIEFALELLKDVEVNLSQVFLGVGRNDTAQLAAKTVSYVEMVGEPVTKKRLYAVLYNDAPRGRDDIDRVLHHLVDTGRIAMAEFEDVANKMKFHMYGTRDSLLRLKEKLARSDEQP
jgi:hypothetical protein